MSERIEEIKGRLENIRPGPWVRNKHRGDLDMVRQANWTGCEDPRHDDCAIAQFTSPEVAIVRPGHPEYDAAPNAEFIAHAREDIPYLLQKVEKLEKENLRRSGELEALDEENARLQSKLERRDQQIAEIRQGAEF
jgi:hypothetical protein